MEGSCGEFNYWFFYAKVCSTCKGSNNHSVASFLSSFQPRICFSMESPIKTNVFGALVLSETGLFSDIVGARASLTVFVSMVSAELSIFSFDFCFLGFLDCLDFLVSFLAPFNDCVVLWTVLVLNWGLGKNWAVSENYAIANGQNFKEGAWLLNNRRVDHCLFVMTRSLGVNCYK